MVVMMARPRAPATASVMTVTGTVTVTAGWFK
jgi:hypothetical protein